MAIPPCPINVVKPRPAAARTPATQGVTSTNGPRRPAKTTRPATGTPPTNDAPFTKILYRDPVTGRHARSRITADVGRIGFETSAPIRRFPTYRGRRSHQGCYWFSRSQSHVQFESRFEMTALMVLDFSGVARAVSSNPFWLLWPHGTKPMRHAPDFFARCRDDSVRIIDVKPAERVTDQDREQHDRTRQVCRELGWEYEEFTEMDTVLERNLRLLSGYRHPRFDPPPDVRAHIDAQVGNAGDRGLRLAELVDAASARVDGLDDRVICAIYHMMWNAQLHTDLHRPLTWNAVVRP